jgi:Gpi18-like mannosyltransferase
MHFLVKIKNITIEPNHLVIFLNNQSKKQFTFEDIDKVFITVEKRNSYLYFASLLIGIAIIASLQSIVSIITTIILALFAVITSSVAWYFSKRYQLVIRLKSKEYHRYSLCNNSKLKVLKKVRVIRAKLQEINFKQLKKVESHD